MIAPRHELRDYQRTAVDRLAGVLDKRPILVAPTGSGKTEVATALIERLGARTLWLAHRKELIDQAALRLMAHGLEIGVIKCGYPETPKAPVQVASVQTLIRREMPPADLIVVDECFPAGTMIDGRPIEHVEVGDAVACWDGRTGRLVTGRVIRTFRNPAPDKLLRLSVGTRRIVCTTNHPILTAPGRWVPARGLVAGDHVYELPRMRRPQAGPEGAEVSDLLPSGNVRTEPPGSAGAHADAQPRLEARGEGEDQRHAARGGTPSSGPRGERSPHPSPAAAPGGCVGLADGARRSGRNGARPRPADALQTGYREPGRQGRHRSGRQLACPERETAAGPQEGGVPRLARVDRVEVLERGGDAGFEQLCPDGYVYNLEIARYHTYLANGIVVHNCHHARADSYGKILDAYPNANVVGLTATPFRLDGRGLGDVFGELVVAAWAADLCASGILHKPRVWASLAPDLRGVKVTAGDYNVGELAKRSNTAELQADVVETWLKHANGKRTVAFAVDVEHSESITDAFCRAGIAAEHLDGSTPKDERDAILERLRSGETKIVSNCMVLTEGWDLPALECAIIARPTASLNLHIQMIGRVMRATDGKDGAIVLDHAGNHHVHGLVTRKLKYSLGDEKVGFSEPLGLRRCQACGLFFENTLDACPECGWTLPTPVASGRQIIHKPGDLAEFDDGSFTYRRQVWISIEAERQASGYLPGWSYYRFKDRFDVDPVVVDGELIDPRYATAYEKRRVYEDFVRTAQRKGFKRGWASYRYKDIFGCWPRGFVVNTREALGV